MHNIERRGPQSHARAGAPSFLAQTSSLSLPQVDQERTTAVLAKPSCAVLAKPSCAVLAKPS